jgi:hypothetical protein
MQGAGTGITDEKEQDFLKLWQSHTIFLPPFFLLRSSERMKKKKPRLAGRMDSLFIKYLFNL